MALQPYPPSIDSADDRIGSATTAEYSAPSTKLAVLSAQCEELTKLIYSEYYRLQQLLNRIGGELPPEEGVAAGADCPAGDIYVLTSRIDGIATALTNISTAIDRFEKLGL